jgi:hypothetical protein
LWWSLLRALYSIQNSDRRKNEEGKYHHYLDILFFIVNNIFSFCIFLKSCLSCYKKLIGGSEGQSLVLNNDIPAAGLDLSFH